ncbi:hypothetical protein HanPSC8_Chr14g0629271 [Helianthus annuus]|nr:hypothetical protein HanPSC8_Chr14g0629271 [Helianthus annuus]
MKVQMSSQQTQMDRVQCNICLAQLLSASQLKLHESYGTRVAFNQMVKATILTLGYINQVDF